MLTVPVLVHPRGNGRDDYDNILKAVEEINRCKNGTLVFDKDGKYFINQHRIDELSSGHISTLNSEHNDKKNFIFEDCTHVTIQGNGSVLKFLGEWDREANWTNANGYTYSQHNSIGFQFINSQNITISDLELHGGCDKTKKIATAEGKSYGIKLDGCDNIKLENIHIHHYHADGLLVGYRVESGQKLYQTKNLIVKNCNFTNNARQGCSIIQLKHGVFENCLFSESGKTGKYGGHSPQAGVDIEPEYDIAKGIDELTGDIKFINCIFCENVGDEYIATNELLTPYPVTFENCTFKSTKAIEKRDLKYNKISSSIKNTVFKNCNFENTAMTLTHKIKDVECSVKVTGCRFYSSHYAHSTLFSVGHKSLNLEVKECCFSFMNDVSTVCEKNGKYRFYLRNAKTIFENNHIFVDKNEHYLQDSSIRFLLENGVSAKDNIWHTNLFCKNKKFSISYKNSTSECESCVPKDSFKRI